MTRSVTKRSVVVVVILSLFGSLAAVLYTRSELREDRQTITALTLQDIEKELDRCAGGIATGNCAARFQGSRVRWRGTVTAIDGNNVVYVATNVFPTDVEFQLSRNSVKRLSVGKEIDFTGTISKVVDAETFPPMAHPYVYFKQVTIDRGSRAVP
jgi:hypothetical protein